MAAFRRVRGRMDGGGAFKRVSRRETTLQHAMRSDGYDEEQQQQAEEQRQKKENDERRHQNRPSALRLRLAVFAAGLKLPPHFAQV